MPSPKVDPTLKLEQLLESERAALTAQGRITPEGQVLAAPDRAAENAKPVVPRDNIVTADDQAQADAILKTMVPPEAIERAKLVKNIESSFVFKDEQGNVTKTSGDGGARAAQAEAEHNPDWRGRPKEDPVTFEDKTAFLAHILGCPYFEKSYTIFGGAVTVTFRTMTDDQLAMCRRQAWSDDKLDGTNGPQGSEESYQTRLARFVQYKLVGELYSVKLKDDVPRIYTPFAHDSNLKVGEWPIRVAKHEFTAGTSVALAQAIAQANAKFTRLTMSMQAAADDPSFWKAGSDT
jgi:hypothetical protein